MDIKEMDQGLLKRNPSLTLEQFKHHWLHKHAPLVVPFFLSLGLQHYEQIHGPLSPISTSPPASILTLISNYDGAVGFPPQVEIDKPMNLPKWKEDYYREVILADERRFLVSEALAHIKRLEPQTVKGERKVVINEGKCLIEVPESVWEVWREYEARGAIEGEKQ